jgi:sulfatase maturation enzyme AslB (radical SAM superfamily)
LVKKDTGFFDTDQICNFVERFLKFYNHKKASISFVGGEPLLVAKRLINVINQLNKLDVEFDYGITTNLANDMDDDVLLFLSKLNKIIVSIDGDHLEHNTQRKPIDGNYDPFVKSIQNIKTLMKLGFQNKISVQAALRDEFITTDHKTRYYKNLLKIGVLPDCIKFACIHPTKDKKASEILRKS